MALTLSPADAGLIVAGGAVGTGLRAGLGLAMPVGWVSIPTLVANVVGAFAIGVLYTVLARRATPDRPLRGWRLFAGTGVLGGFTTYSALCVSAASAGLAGAAYALVTLASGLLAVWAGSALAGGRR